MDTINLIELIIIIISFIISTISIYYTMKTKKRYESIVMRLGAGEDLTKIMNSYIAKVNDIEKKDDQIMEYCTRLNNEIGYTIKKIGLVKYDAYNNTNNKLSFALALLNRENSGIIINSVYGIDNSNVYAKRIIKGTSKYNLSSEEIDAIKIAIENK